MRLGGWVALLGVTFGVTWIDMDGTHARDRVEAAQHTCQGEPATIVGTPQRGELSGTPGRDVIVTNGARNVYALAGNDLICVTKTTDFVDAGEGDDEVNTADGNQATSTTLGPGVDILEGGPRPDLVTPGEGTDVIATGAGRDSYTEDSSTGPNDDVIDLGRGRDHAFVGINPFTGSVNGGTGRDILSPGFGREDSRGQGVVDNRIKVATLNGDTWLRWSNFEDFRFDTFLPDVALTFIGSAAEEHIFAAQSLEFGPDIDLLSTGGGDDRIVFSGLAAPIQAGRGRDRLEVVHFVDGRSLTPAREIAINLHEQVMQLDAGIQREFEIRGVEDVKVGGFGAAFLEGTAKSNKMLAVYTCFTKLVGRGGADILSAHPRSECSPRMAAFFGVPSQVQAFGGRGNDRLVGRKTNDVLVGGRGHDGAYGRRGFDRCRADVRASCEA